MVRPDARPAARSGIQAVATSHPNSTATTIIARDGTTTPTTYRRFAAHHVLDCPVAKITARTAADALDRAVGAP
jgi:hypothetical protein